MVVVVVVPSGFTALPTLKVRAASVDFKALDLESFVEMTSLIYITYLNKLSLVIQKVTYHFL